MTDLDQTVTKAVSMTLALARQLPADSPLPEPTGDELWDQPTDILGFDAVGQALARALEPLVSLKEICYYDPEHDPTLRSNPTSQDSYFHYWPFFDMLEKSEFMFINLPATPANLALFDDLSRFNHNMKVIIISSGFESVAERLIARCEAGQLGGVASVPQDRILTSYPLS